MAFLSHCGSRGIGHNLASGQFKALQRHFEKWNIPLPGDDRELVYAPLGTPEADAYIDDMSLGANFATVNHLLIVSFRQACLTQFSGLGTLVGFLFEEDNHGWTKAWRHSEGSGTWAGSV